MTSSATGPLSPATTRQLRTLRFRLAVLLASLMLVVVSLFAWTVIRLDARLRDEQNDATLLREVDGVTRELAFDFGQLEPTDPSPLLGDSVAVGVRPDFDVLTILDEQDLWDEIPEPSDDEIDDLVDEVFFELEPDLQDEVLLLAQAEGETRDDRIGSLLADPPDDFIDEAWRIYVTDTAEERGLELISPVDLFAPEGVPLTDEELLDVVDRVTDDDPGPFTVVSDGVPLGVRGTVLRDGPEVRGAVVAFVDLASSDAAHRRLRNQVLAVAVTLVAGSALVAWFVAGRSIRPTAAALGQQERFLAAAAHELRTPVAAIRATAEAPLASDDDARRPLARVAELAANASRLTDDLLTLARMDADRVELHTTPTRLDLLVEAAVDGDPAYRLDLEPVVAEADVTLLTRAIENLLRNAVVHGEASAEHPATVIVDGTGITVVDRGPGLPAEERDLIFERFRTRPGSPGHGLGLPLARWIARAHRGDLVAIPADRGARLHLRLPVHPADG